MGFLFHFIDGIYWSINIYILIELISLIFSLTYAFGIMSYKLIA